MIHLIKGIKKSIKKIKDDPMLLMIRHIINIINANFKILIITFPALRYFCFM